MAVGLTSQSAAGSATGFIHEPSGTLVGMRSGGTAKCFLTDAQNMVIGLVDIASHRIATYTYGPYGEPHTNTGTQQPFRYTSAYLDANAQYKMGAHYYDPNSAASPPTPVARKATPTSTPPVTLSRQRRF
jgi:hypothetical protein